jgi:hypothetical protein
MVCAPKGGYSSFGAQIFPTISHAVGLRTAKKSGQPSIPSGQLGHRMTLSVIQMTLDLQVQGLCEVRSCKSGSLNADQWAREIGKIRGVQDLPTGIAFTVKRGDGRTSTRATRIGR